MLDGDRGVAADERGQRGCHERERLAGARRDDHVVGRARDAARLAEVVGDLLAERRDAERRRRLRRDVERCGVPPRRAPRARVDARGRRPARQQVDPRACARAPRGAVPADASRGREPGSAAAPRRRFATLRGIRPTGPAPGPVGGGRTRVSALERRHAGRRALAHLEVALAGELLVRRDHRAAGDAELGRERPRRGHGVAGYAWRRRGCRAAARRRAARRWAGRRRGR